VAETYSRNTVYKITFIHLCTAVGFVATFNLVEWKRNLMAHGDAREEK